MARPQEQQVTQRRAIATIEDQNKYSMPDGRRLRVVADPLRMNVEAEVPDTVRLAEALAQVKPTIMAGLADEASDRNAQEVQQGILERTQGLPPDEARSEWRQYGYEQQSAFLIGEDLGSKLEADIQSKDPNVPFEQWYGEWWQANAQGVPNKPEQAITFNKSFTKSLLKARDFDTKNVLALQKEQQATVATENMFRAITDIRRKNLPVTTNDWSALKNDISKGFSNAETDALFYNALERYALENNDVDALNVLYERRGEVPALVDNPKYTQKIVDLRFQVLGKKVAEHKALESQKTDAIKVATDQFEQDIRFKIIGLSNIENPVEKSAQLSLIMKEVEDAKGKYNFSTGFLNTLESRITKTDKGEATEFQNQTFRTLYTGNPSQSVLDREVAEGNITQSQWTQLMTKRQADAERAKRLSEKGEKPITTNPMYKRVVEEIKGKAGYSSNNMTADGVERNTNYTKAKQVFTEVLDENIDSGMGVKEAIADAQEKTDKYMDKMGIVSTQWKKLEAKENKLEMVSKNPVGYYSSNIDDFKKDYDAKTLPSTLTPEQKAVLQRKYQQKLRGDSKKPKTTESKVN